MEYNGANTSTPFGIAIPSVPRHIELNHFTNGQPRVDIPRVLVEAKDYFIGWLTGAPFVSMI